MVETRETVKKLQIKGTNIKIFFQGMSLNLNIKEKKHKPVFISLKSRKEMLKQTEHLR